MRLGDLKLGGINVHVPGDKANFQGDFDFTVLTWPATLPLGCYKLI
jgi:hypothetical protein